jgi:hypothetical protein
LSLFTTFSIVGREEKMVINGQERMMGEMEYPDGGEYTGQLHGDERNGLGSYFRVDDSKLFGEWVNNRLHGVACQWQTNHDMFCGIWVDGEINGLGIYRAGDKTSSLVGYYVGNRVAGCGIWATEVNGTMVIERLRGGVPSAGTAVSWPRTLSQK